MKRTFLWLGCGILATGMAFAQDTTSSGASGSQDQNTQTRTQSTATQNNTVRGCLSGSPGNYTITDHNGTQWTVTGDDATLRNSVGRQVEITFTQHQSSDESSQGATTTRRTHSVQASQVTALSDTCNAGSGMANPGGASGSAEPSSPRMMSMLMQQSMPGQSQNGTSSQPQTTPPVTSQTPATSTSPTSGTSSQQGTSPASNSGMTEGQANSTTGQTAGTSVSTQGANPSGTANSATTTPNATTSSPNSATPSNAQSPQANSNDQNKPLYERQATDIPWAKSSAGNNGTPAPPH
jgi:hypothetical protein